ncbi:TorF family putative porin [Alteromonas gilva]|uniref:TorF family putative porin n=1 Tax=Alteromonas gilva TaxID=2987522 RepID=A0ABT5L5G9_9ALTE|nr:TorF family putative porin [Alteromonas gilva]MDC8832112.1 TorF family putative porin [Alteromonas gilva]
MKFNKTLVTLAVVGSCLTSQAALADSFSANVSVANNYIWRGLTQTTNEPAVSGGIDYASDSGFYAGTWASNVQYGSDDVYSYEHDLYLGFAGESGDISYDFGYLYYNYDEEAGFDFGEIYGTVGYGGFSATLYVLANAEPDEGVDQDFGFGSTTYLSLDYGFALASGTEIGLHAGSHQGDFNEAFNGVPGDYRDFAVTVSNGGFAFMISTTDLDDAGPDATDNDSVKYTVSYSVDFEL